MQPDEVQVWRLPLSEASADFARSWTWLAEDERNRAERMRFPHPRTQFVLGRGCLRFLLSRHLNCQPSEVPLSARGAGKPILAEGPDLRFNLSHSHGQALIALSHSKELGIDIEMLRDLPNMVELVKRNFGPRERELWDALPTPQRCEGFFLAWTRKEAYLKARGLGFTRGVDAVEVALVPGTPAVLLDVAGEPEELERWSLLDLPGAENYRAALVVEGKEARVSDHIWDWAKIQEGGRF